MSEHHGSQPDDAAGRMPEEQIEDLEAPAEAQSDVAGGMRCQVSCPPMTCLSPSCVQTTIQ